MEKVKVKFDKDLALVRLAKMIKFIDKKPLVPVMSCFKLNITKNTIFITAINGNVEVSSQFPCSSKENMSVWIPAQLFSDTVKNFRDIDIVMDIEEVSTGVSVELKSGKSKYKMMGFKGDTLSPMIEPSPNNNMVIYGKLFKKTMSIAQNIADPSSLKMNLQGIQIDEKDSEALICAAREIYMFRSKIKPKSIVKWSPVHITVDTATKVVQVTDDNDDVEIVHDDNKILFLTEHYKVVAVVHKSKMPDLEPLFKKRKEEVTILNNVEITDVLKRISLYTNQESSQVVFNFNQNILIITGHDINRSVSGEEEISIMMPIAEKKLGFSSDFFQKITNFIDDQDIEFYPGHITAGESFPSPSFFTTVELESSPKKYEFCLAPMMIL